MLVLHSAPTPGDEGFLRQVFGVSTGGFSAGGANAFFFSSPFLGKMVNFPEGRYFWKGFKAPISFAFSLPALSKDCCLMVFMILYVFEGFQKTHQSKGLGSRGS